MIRILLVDDQHLVQQGIKSLIDQTSELTVIKTVDNGRSAVQEIEYLRPDIVLLDIEMPGMNGITTTKYITRLSPRTKVIILSSHEEKKYVTQALMAGAKGYILKSSLMSDLKQAIIAVNNGYSQIDSKLLAKVFDPSNFKPKKRQSNQNRVQSKIAIAKESRKRLVESRSQLYHAKSTVQNPDLLELDSRPTPSGKYQLGTLSADSDESEKSPTQSPPQPSPLEIIKADLAESDVSERDTFIQDPQYNQELLELRNIDSDSSNLISPDQNSPSNLTEDIAEFSSLEEVLPKVKPDSSNKSEARSRAFYGESSAVDLSLDLPVKEPSYLPSEIEKSGRTKTIARSANNKNNLSSVDSANLTQYRPVRKRKKSKSLVKKLLEKSFKYSWFWNSVLMIFGAVLVIVIGSL